jgi:serine phosphatase RsbU (regulator of sigma subunit)
MILYRSFYLFLFVLAPLLVSAQQAKIDSLKRSLNSASSDTAKVNRLNKLTEYFIRELDLENAETYQKKAFSIATEENFKEGIALAIENDASIDDAKSNFSSAIEKFRKALELYTELGNKKKIGAVYQGIANSYYSKGLTEKALVNYMSSLKVREQLGDSSGISNSMMGLSNVYNDMKRNDLSLSYGLKALGIKQRLNETRTVSWLLNNIGITYLNMGDTTKALEFYERSLEIKRSINDEYGIATTYKNIAGILMERHEFEKALDYYRKSYSLRLKINPDDHHNHAKSLGEMGAAFLNMRKTDSAYYYTLKAIEEGELAGSYDALASPYMNMANILSLRGEHDKALGFMKKHIEAKDSMLNTQTNQLMTEMASRYDSEKTEQQLALQSAEISKQKQFENSLFIIIALIIVFAIVVFSVIYKGYRNKKKANELLSEKNVEIENQKTIVEEKNKDITDSIHYAKRIQQSILPSEELRKTLLPESFILFKPKAIVSGDFFWVEKLSDKIFIAVVDCTGHGVPGAFMTFMAYSLLNEAVMEHGIASPAAILDEMRSTLKKMLRQKNETDALRDGMDISLCVFDPITNSLEYAGAYNPLWIIRHNELVEVQADKQPIGAFIDADMRPFRNHQMQLQQGDSIYLFTDGYADQFGGSKGKKFKYKSLLALFIKIHDLPVEEQKTILEDTINDWMKGLEQVDDICIFGMQIK